MRQKELRFSSWLVSNWDLILALGTGATILIMYRVGSISQTSIPAFTLLLVTGSFFALIIDRYKSKSQEDKTSVTLLSHTSKVETLISDTLPCDFSSKEADISGYRCEWHHYHITLMNGRKAWRHSIYDFAKSSIPTKLHASVNYLNQENIDIPYIVDAGLRSDRLIAFIRPKTGSEPVWIEVYPFFHLSHSSITPGFAMLQTFDFVQELSPCILSKKELHTKSDIGIDKFLFSDKGKELTALWRKELINRNFIILPEPD